MSLVNLKIAANILSITTRKLAYLCKTGKVSFTVTPTGRKQFDTDILTIEPKISSDKAKKVGHPLCPDGYITASEVAERLGVTVQTIYRYIREKRMFSYHPGGTRSHYFEPLMLEVSGKVTPKNTPPQISEPEIYNEELKYAENSINSQIGKALDTFSEVMRLCVINVTDMADETMMNFIKNSMMYKIQKMDFVV